MRAAMLATGAPGAAAAVQLIVRDAGGDAERAGDGVAELARGEAVIGVVAAADRKTASTATVGAGEGRRACPLLALDDAAPGSGHGTAFQLVHTLRRAARALARRALAGGRARVRDARARQRGWEGAARGLPAATSTAGGGRVTADGELPAGRDVVHGGGRRPQEGAAAGGVRGGRRRSPGADRAGAGRRRSVARALGRARPAGRAGQAAAAQRAAALDGRRSVAAAAAERGALRPGGAAGAGLLRRRRRRARRATFVDAYRAAYGQDPHATEAYAFDGVNALRAAAAAGGAHARRRPARARGRHVRGAHGRAALRPRSRPRRPAARLRRRRRQIRLSALTALPRRGAWRQQATRDRSRRGRRSVESARREIMPGRPSRHGLPVEGGAVARDVVEKRSGRRAGARARPARSSRALRRASGVAAQVVAVEVEQVEQVVGQRRGPFARERSARPWRAGGRRVQRRRTPSTSRRCAGSRRTASATAWRLRAAAGGSGLPASSKSSHVAARAARATSARRRRSAISCSQPSPVGRRCARRDGRGRRERAGSGAASRARDVARASTCDAVRVPDVRRVGGDLVQRPSRGDALGRALAVISPAASGRASASRSLMSSQLRPSSPPARRARPLDLHQRESAL